VVGRRWEVDGWWWVARSSGGLLGKARFRVFGIGFFLAFLFFFFLWLMNMEGKKGKRKTKSSGQHGSRALISNLV